MQDLEALLALSERIGRDPASGPGAGRQHLPQA